MTESAKFELRLTGDAGGAYIHQDYKSGTTLPTDFVTGVGFAAVEGIINLPTGKELDLSVYLKVIGGGDSLANTKIARSSPLSGPFDRAYYLLSRSNIVGNYFGIDEAFVEGKFNTPGLIFRAGIAHQESFVYPYDFNAGNCAIGDFKWSCSTSRSNPHDNTVWTNPYTAYTGPLFNLEWIPPFFSDLKFDLQTATDWTPPVNPLADEGAFKRWITTAQTAYRHEYKMGENSAVSSLAFFYSNDRPASSQNDKGETVLPAHAIGLYLFQGIENAKFALGYGHYQNGTSGLGIDVNNQVHSINAGVSYGFLRGRLITNASYAWVGLSSETRSSLIQDSTKGNEHTLDLSATGALVKGLSATVGWNGFWGDSAQALIGGVTFRSSVYTFVGYSYIHSWGGG